MLELRVMSMADTPPKQPPGKDRRRCLLSGAGGYVGSRIKEKLTAEGWQVIELSRKPDANSNAIRFQLGGPISSESLVNCAALIHCAYDFTGIDWKDIYEINVRGSEVLLRAAEQAGVKRLVFISTTSAFDGCQSLYGKGKLEVERVTHSLGGWVIRPGLVYGERPGGMLGRLVGSVKRSRVIPIPGRGTQLMYLAHEADVAEAVLECIRGERSACATSITVAHEEPWTLRSMVLAIACAINRDVVFLPIPWRLMWAGLRLTEALSMPVGFRSDSLVSLVNQNSNPILNAFEVLGVKCRPFQPRLIVDPRQI
jgi:nucleoside-diphosphate-sugar epimerase